MVAYSHVLKAQVVADPAEIDRLRWFQVRRYVECGLIDSVPERLDPDPIADQATYFAVYDVDGAEILATTRILHGRAGSLPLVQDFDLFEPWGQVLESLGDDACEITRLAIADHVRKVPAFAALSREMLHWGLSNTPIRAFVASAERPFAAILERRLLMKCDLIGHKLQDYYNAVNVPVMIDVVEWIDRLRRQNLDMWHYFVDDLVIDPSLYDLPSCESLYEQAASKAS